MIAQSTIEWSLKFRRFAFLVVLVALWKSPEALAGSLHLSSAPPTGSTTFELKDFEGGPVNLPRWLSASIDIDLDSIVSTGEIHDEVIFTLAAPEGTAFVVSPTDPDSQYFSLLFDKIGVTEGLFLRGYTASFTQSSGTVPVFSDPLQVVMSFDPKVQTFMIKVPVTEAFTFTGFELHLTTGGTPGQMIWSEGKIRMSVFDENYKGDPDALPELLSIAPIPEPGTVAMLLLPALILACQRRMGKGNRS